ncbi:MAG TPA: hypothetical protein VFR41_13705 [Acidimicrobiia bacterium]|nr:hypothetical protein [Acidimicrobiia bacterium]
MRRWCALIVMLAACGSSTRAKVTPASTTSSSVNTSTTRAHAIPTVVPRTTVRATVPPATSSTVATARAHRQLIVVSAGAYGSTSAVLRAYERRGNTWQLAYGPWTVIGAMHGFAPPGEKREGDGRVPSGQFGFGFMFGIEPNPGVRAVLYWMTTP